MTNGDIFLLAEKDSYSMDFAKKIKDYIWNHHEQDVYLGELIVTKFRNGEIGLHVPNNIRGKDVYFIHDSNKNPQDWWVELLLLKDLLLNSSAESVTFVLPDMTYSRQDRKDKPHVPISARALAHSISPGLRRIITMDLHAPQIQGFYPQNVPFDNLYSFLDTVRHLIKMHPMDLKNLVIVSPDAGGTDRARSFLRKLQSLSGGEYSFALIDKTRIKAGEIEKMELVGDVTGKDVLIIDDIIDSGGTLVKAGKLLKEKGARKLMCYGTHGLFTAGTQEIKSIYDVVITSNSHKQNDLLVEVVDVSHLFAEAIYRAQNGLSISKLFE